MIYVCNRKEKPPSNGVDQGPPIVVLYHRGAHAQAFLGAWRGHLMVDNYASYNVAVQPGRHGAGVPGAPTPQLLRPACDQRQLGRGQGAADARVALRQVQAKPLLPQCRQWLVATHLSMADGSGTSKTIDQCQQRWPALVQHTDSGALPRDNKQVENAIGPIAICTKN